MKEGNQIPEYVFASIERKANEQESKLTKEWLNNPENQKIYAEIEEINSLSNDLKLFNRFNLYLGKIDIQKKIRQVKTRYLLTTIQKIAAILLVPVLFGSLWILYQNNNLKKDLVAAEVIQEIKSQPGVKMQFLLPDGTEVWLNAASKIKFPTVFRGGTRSVELDGEAYFKVFKNKQKPFVVKAQNVEVTALGTAFNLCAYKEDNTFYTTLEEGKVRVIDTENTNKQYILNPNEQILFNIKDKTFSKSIVNVDRITSWKDGKLIFDEIPFQQVVLTLGRWFNANILLADQSIANYRYTGTFINENLDQVLELLKLTAPIEYSYKKREPGENNEFTKEEIIIREDPGATLINK